MKLATRTLLTIALTFFGLAAALFVLSHTIFLGGYEALEREDAERNVGRALSALTADLDAISALNVDWASWDDTYDFVVTKDSDYIKSTLNVETLAKLRLNVIIYLNDAGEAVFARALDHSSEELAELPGDLMSHAGPGGRLLPDGEDGGVAGMLALKDGVLMFASNPVLTSEGKGPRRGSLLMGRFLDKDAVERLAGTTHMKLDALRPGGPLEAGIEEELLKSPAGVLVSQRNDDRVDGYGLVKDVYGAPAVVLKAELDRGIYRHGRAVVLKFMACFALVAVVAAAVVIFLIQKTVLERLKALGRRVSEIAAHRDLKARIPLSGEDELTELAKKFNMMMESLDESDERRADAEEELRAANEELEERVQERTVDLREANLALKDEIAERTRMEGVINDMAYHDHLTGLPNRALLSDRLSQIITRGAWHNTTAGVLFLDIDRFKVVNDTLGHTAGDELIRLVSVELRRVLRDGDTVARMGGDEFTILLQDLGKAEDIHIVVQNLFDAFKKPVTVAGHEVFVNFSVGVAVYPHDGNDVETILKNADIAMYQAKGKGGNAFEMFNPAMAEKAFDRLTISNKLRSALEKREFTLFYQPQVDLVSGRITGSEALIRWQDPEKGLVMPGSFIHLAEETGVIMPMGEWGIFEACAQNMELQRSGFKDLSVSVNISGRMFTQRGFPGIVESALRETGLKPEHLVLEITESTLMTNIAMAAEIINEIRALGVRFSIDDFGTGYSSLAYLKSLPLSELKIDRSFVRDIHENLDDQLIVTAIIKLAQSLRLRVLAEGVETDEQRRFLVAQQCDMTQGYLFSRPLPFESFKTLLVSTGGSLGAVA